jgi:predicted  nucleic acid-binding Zn-ribbon protein
MPHQCTNCERTFPDGSKEMLSGCPDCGGNKFQFRPDSDSAPPTLGDAPADGSTGTTDSRDTPDGRPSPTPSTTDSPPRPSPDDAFAPDTTADSDDAFAPDTTGGETTASHSASTEPADDDGAVAESESTAHKGEDTAQADARTDVITRDELDRAVTSPPSDSVEDVAEAIPPDSAKSPDIDDLRRELNDQFESIRIVEPGQYELNLMELYDREECIISLQEDGHYVIEVGDTWRDD